MVDKSTAIKLPMLSSPKTTLERWGTELRARLNEDRDIPWVEFDLAFRTSGSMTATSVTRTVTEYRDTKDGWVDFNLFAVVLLGGVANIALKLVLPIPMKADSIMIGWGQNGVTWSNLVMVGRDGLLEADIYKPDASFYTLANTSLYFTGRYRKA